MPLSSRCYVVLMLFLFLVSEGTVAQKDTTKTAQSPSVPSDAIYDVMTDTFHNSDVCSVFQTPKEPLLSEMKSSAGDKSVNDALNDTISAISKNSPLSSWSKSLLAVTIGAQCPECAAPLKPGTGAAKATAYIFHIVTWNTKKNPASDTTVLVPALSEWHVYRSTTKDTLKFTGIDSSGEPRIYNKRQILLVGIDQFSTKEDFGTIAAEYKSTVTQGAPQNVTDLTALLGALAGVSGTTPTKAEAAGVPACDPKHTFIASRLIIGSKALPFTDKIAYAADDHYASSTKQPSDPSTQPGTALSSKPSSKKATLNKADTTCTTPNACVDMVIQSNTSQLTVDVSGTFSGTLRFQSSDDGANFTDATAIPASGDGKGVQSTNSPGTWTLDATKLKEFRVAASALNSGTPNVEIHSTPSSPNAKPATNQGQKSDSTTSDNSGVMSCTGDLNSVPCTSTRTFTSNDREWWDVSIGVATPGVRESQYSIVNSALKTTVTTHTDLYGFVDIYPFAWAADKNDWAPHAIAGVPLTSKSLYRPAFGLAEPISGLLSRIFSLKKQLSLPVQFSAFGGMVWMKTTVVNGNPTTSAALSADQQSTRVWKPVFGVEVSVSSMLSKIKGAGSKNSNSGGTKSGGSSTNGS